MALSAAEKKRQEELRRQSDKLGSTIQKKKAERAKAQKDAEAKTKKEAQVREQFRRDIRNRNLNNERERLTKQAEVSRIWGGGAAVDKKLKNDLAYVEKQRPQGGVKPEVPLADTGRYVPGGQQVKFRSPAIGAPVHARPSAFGSATQLQNGILSARPQPSAYAPQVGQAPRPNAPQPSSSSYRDGGKGLYKGSEEYVKATGGNYNPLMQRTFGYQTGQHPGAQQPQPAAPAQPQQPQTSPQYNGNDEPGALGQAENPMKLLGDLLNRKKLSISVSN
jgi:hypothetical protein